MGLGRRKKENRAFPISARNKKPFKGMIGEKGRSH